MDKIILIGGGGHCNSVIDVIEAEGRFEIAGIVDQFQPVGSGVLDYKVIGKDNDLSSLVDEVQYALITVGQIKTAELKSRLYQMVKSYGFHFPVVISPRAYVSRYSSIGGGTVVMHDALVNANTKIGCNCIINTKSLIEHDTTIGNHCHVSTGAVINGGVHVGDNCFIGSNAVTSEGLHIDDGSFIKAGTLVKC